MHGYSEASKVPCRICLAPVIQTLVLPNIDIANFTTVRDNFLKHGDMPGLESGITRSILK